MAEHNSAGTCLICKHALVSKLNIFKTRTSFSKTLMSSMLSKIVQAPFRQGDAANAEGICTSCSALINELDECEIKLMALENEVKLKYKMPFPIEVQSRRTEVPAAEEEPPVAPPVGQVEQLISQPAGQQFGFIDGGELDHHTIVLEAGKVDVEGGNVIVYREPTGDQLGDGPAMPYLNVLETSDLHQEDNSEADHGDRSDPYDRQSVKGSRRRRRRFAKRRRTGVDGEHGALLCELCDRTFTSVDSLHSHQACHANNKTLDCGFCPRVFANNIALHDHWNMEHPLKLRPCPYCDERFVNKSTLRRHVITHQEPRFSCEECGKPFHVQADLRKHIVFKHSDVKNFHCSQCHLSFKLNWMLTRHRLCVHA